MNPFQVENNIDANFFKDQNIDNWRYNKQGIRYLHKSTNLEIYGAVDDVWIKPNSSHLRKKCRNLEI